MLLAASPAKAYSGTPTTCHLLSNPVTVDGKWTTLEEWSDSLETPLYKSFSSTLNGTGYFYTKHDSDYVYALLDFISDASQDQYDQSVVFLDTGHDGGSVAKVDDYAFALIWTNMTSSRFSMWKGTGAGWQTVDSQIAFLTPVPGSLAASSLSASPRSSTLHMVYEFRIPKTIFAASSSSIGLAMVLAHKAAPPSAEVLLTWPRDTLRDIPDKWGELTFSSTPIPEFPNPTTVLVALVALTFCFSGRKRNHAHMR